MPVLINIPNSSRIDTIWTAKITGLEPKEKTVISVTMVDTFGNTWKSQAEFEASDRGEIDLKTQSPKKGSYNSADPMGLIWSMTCKNTHGLLARRSDLSPVIFKISVLAKDIVQAEKTVTRYLIEPSVIRQEIRQEDLVGTLYLPDDDGERKAALIVLSGSEGGFRQEQAALLASEGYVALALAYFNVPSVPHFPTAIKEIPLEYFGKAIEFLKNHPRVSSQHIGVVGASRGGELALLLGTTFPDLKAVVAYVPNYAIQAAFGPSDHLTDEKEPSWTYQGKTLPCFPLKVKNVDWFSGSPVVLKNGFLILTESQDIDLDAIIKVEKIGGPVLLISGGNDEMWPSEKMADLIMERLQQKNHPYFMQSKHLHYPKAGHLIMTPWWPTTGGHAIHPIDHIDYVFGGSPEADAQAGYDSWQQIMFFLEKNLPLYSCSYKN